MNFLLETGSTGSVRFLYTEGEEITDRDGKQVYVYGNKEMFTAVENPAGPGSCRVIRSTMGGNKTVFYLKHNGRYYIFTSLKLLSAISYQCRFQDDPELISEFIYNGFIRTKDTLVRDVYKLLPEEYLEIEAGELNIHRLERTKANRQKVSLDQMYERERTIINSYIDLALSKKGQVNLAISGGFDSNLILHFLKEREIPSCGFSVGAARGLDETGVAANLCAHAGNVSLRKGSVGPKIRERLEEIVETLEGNLYERGIFLQYALAKLLKEEHVRYILLGEGADQVFNRNFYDRKAPPYLTNYNDNPYELGAMVVLKKSVLMLEAFGITGLYPFISRKMQDLGAEIMEENGVSKIRQKEMCRKYFDDETNSLVGKNPGSTSLCALFRDSEDEEAFIAKVKETNEFYDPSFRISYKYGPGESELDYYLCLEYLRIFKKIFCSG